MSTAGKTWRRIPKLSGKPHPQRGLFYSTYGDDETGKQRFEFFAEDLKESQKQHRAWVLNNYDQPGILPVAARSDKSAPSSFVAMANAFLSHERGRTVTARVRDDNRRQILDITEWFIAEYGDRCHTQSLHELLNETDCEKMLRHFAKKYTASQFDKRRQRFWSMVRFARRKPWSSRLDFDPQDLERVVPKPSREKKLPTVPVLQELLSYCSVQQQCEIWMGIGLGFGQLDLSISESQCFDADDFDLRRAKNGLPRYGKMRPLVWAYLNKYMTDSPRKNGELLFVTDTGLPLVRVKDKSPAQIERERKANPDKEPSLYTRIDTVAMWWNRKLLRLTEAGWGEGFYILRHIGATALASRQDVTITELRDFMGHKGGSRVTDRYVKKTPPEAKALVTWVNRMLDSDEVDAWLPDRSLGKRDQKTA